MIKVIVCDDQKEGLALITSSIIKTFKLNQVEVTVTEYSKPMKLKTDIIEGLEVDVLFLDIEMPDLNGIELAKALKDKPDVLIIFVSNVETYIHDALRLNPFTFIRKSHIEKDMLFYAKRITEECVRNKNKFTLTIESNNKMYNFNPYKVMYVEIYDKIITFHESKKTFDIPYKLSKLLSVLEPYHFIQIHRKIAVNTLFIFTIKRGLVILDNGEELPLSKSREDEVRRKFCANAGE